MSDKVFSKLQNKVRKNNATPARITYFSKCPTCLVSNRKCALLEKEQISILVSLGIYENTEVETKKVVCWECYAYIRNIQKFQKRAVFAQTLLSARTDEVTQCIVGLSRLSVSDGRKSHHYFYNEDESTELNELKNISKKKNSLKSEDLTKIKSAKELLYIVVGNKCSKDDKVIIKPVTFKNVSAKNNQELNHTGVKPVTSRNDSEDTKVALNNSPTLLRATEVNNTKKTIRISDILQNINNKKQESSAHIVKTSNKTPQDALKNGAKLTVQQKVRHSKDVFEDIRSNINSTAEYTQQDIEQSKSNPINNATNTSFLDILKDVKLDENVSLSHTHVSTHLFREKNVLKTGTAKLSSAEDVLNQNSHVISGERIIYDSDDDDIEIIEEEEFLDTTQDQIALNVDKAATQNDLIKDKETSKKYSSTAGENFLCDDSDDDSTVTLISTESDINEFDLDEDNNDLPPCKKKEQNIIKLMKEYIRKSNLKNLVVNKTKAKNSASEILAKKSDDDVIELSDDNQHVLDSGNDDSDDDIDFWDHNVSEKMMNSRQSEKTMTGRNESGDTTDMSDDDYDSDKTDDYNISNYVSQITSVQSNEKVGNTIDIICEKTKSTIKTIDVMNTSADAEIGHKIENNVPNNIVTTNFRNDQNNVVTNTFTDENFKEKLHNLTLDSDAQSIKDKKVKHLNSEEKDLPTCININSTENKEPKNKERDKKNDENHSSYFRGYINDNTLKVPDALSGNNIEKSTTNTSTESVNASVDKMDSDNVAKSIKNTTNDNIISTKYMEDTELIKKASTMNFENQKDADRNKINDDLSIDKGHKDTGISDNRVHTEDSECCTENDLNINCSQILLQSDDMLNQSNDDVNEASIKVSESIDTTEFEDIICVSDNKELNSVSKTQADSKLNQQKEKDEGSMQVLEITAANESGERNLFRNYSKFNKVFKMLPETDNECKRQKENVNEESIQVLKSVDANRKINCNHIELNSVTSITNITEDDVMTSNESDLNLAYVMRETPGHDICIENRNKVEEMPSRICNKNSTKIRKHVIYKINTNSNDMVCKEKNKNITIPTQRVVVNLNDKGFYVATKPSVNHRQTMLINRITSGTPPQFSKLVNQKRQSVNFENILPTQYVLNKQNKPSTDLQCSRLNNLLKIAPKVIVRAKPKEISMHKMMTIPTRTPEVIFPNEPESESTSETATDFFNITEPKKDSTHETMTTPISAPEAFIQNETSEEKTSEIVPNIFVTTDKTDSSAKATISITAPEDIIPNESDSELSDSLNIPWTERQKIINGRASLPPLKQYCKIDRIKLYTDIERIWQEHGYAVLSYKRLKDTQKLLKNHTKYLENRQKKPVKKNSVKSKTDVNGESSSDDHYDTMTDDISANDCGKNVLNISANMHTINLNEFFPSYDGAMVNLNDKIEQEPIKTCKDLEANVRYEIEDCLPYGQDTENAYKLINIKQEPDCDIFDYEHEDLEPYYAKVTTNKGIFCHEEIDIKPEPDLESISTISAQEDYDLESISTISAQEDTYQQDFPPENAFTDTRQRVSSDDCSTDHVKCSGHEPYDIVTDTEAKLNLWLNVSMNKTETNQCKELDKVGFSSTFSDFDDDDAQEQPIKNQINNILSNLETDLEEQNVCTEDLLEPVYFIDYESYNYVEKDTMEESIKKQETCSVKTERNDVSENSTRRSRKRICRTSNRRNSKSSLSTIKRKKTKTSKNNTGEEKCDIVPLKRNKIKPAVQRKHVKRQRKISIDEIYRIILGKDIMKEYKVQLNKTNPPMTKPEQVIEDSENNPKNDPNNLDDSKIALIDFIKNNEVITMDEIGDMEEIQQTKDDDENITLSELKNVLGTECGSDRKESYVKESMVQNSCTVLQEKSTEPIQIDMKNFLVQIPLDVIQGLNIAHSIDNVPTPADFTSNCNEEISKAENPNKRKSSEEKISSLMENSKDLKENEEANNKKHRNSIKRKRLLRIANPNKNTINKIKTLLETDNPNEETTNKIKGLIKVDNTKKSRVKIDTSDEKTKLKVKIRARKIVYKNHMRVVIGMEELELLREKERKSERFKNADFKCESCLQIFQKYCFWKKHCKKFHCETTDCHTCPICDSKFARKRLFSMHMEGHRRCFKCLYCDSKYFNWDSLNEHLRQNNHGGQNQGLKLKCHRCDAQFSRAPHLNRHIRSKHKDENFYSIYNDRNPQFEYKSKKKQNDKIFNRK